MHLFINDGGWPDECYSEVLVRAQSRPASPTESQGGKKGASDWTTRKEMEHLATIQLWL